MGLFDKIGGAIGGALETLGGAAATVLEGVVPIATQALGARLGEKLGPRGMPSGVMPGTVAPGLPVPRGQGPPTIFGAALPQQAPVFAPRATLAGSTQMAPTGSGPFTIQQAAMFGPLARQLPGVLGGLAAGEAVDAFFGGGGRGRMPGGIMMNSLFRQTPSGRMSPARVAFMEDGQGGGAFFVNAGVPKTWSKVTLKKRRCHPR